MCMCATKMGLAPCPLLTPECWSVVLTGAQMDNPNSCFTSEKFLGITASKFEFYCMKYLIFFFFETTEH